MADMTSKQSTTELLAYDLAERWLDEEHGDLSADEITLVCQRLVELEEWRMVCPSEDYSANSALWKAWALSKPKRLPER